MNIQVQSAIFTSLTCLNYQHTPSSYNECTINWILSLFYIYNIDCTNLLTSLFGAHVKNILTCHEYMSKIAQENKQCRCAVS